MSSSKKKKTLASRFLSDNGDDDDDSRSSFVDVDNDQVSVALHFSPNYSFLVHHPVNRDDPV
jgi:hypothetical protein